ncbi:hypothetical protein D3C80_860120 [compost metagenome]
MNRARYHHCGWPSAQGRLVVYSCRVGLWGCCAAHRRQASSYTDRAGLGGCAEPVAVGLLAGGDGTGFVRVRE